MDSIEFPVFWLNMFVFVGKHHIYTCTWKKCKPSFTMFLIFCVNIPKFSFKYFKENKVERWETYSADILYVSVVS